VAIGLGVGRTTIKLHHLVWLGLNPGNNIKQFGGDFFLALERYFLAQVVELLGNIAVRPGREMAHFFGQCRST